MQPALADLVRELGLAAFPQHVEGDWLIEGARGTPPLRYDAMRQEPPSMRIAGGTEALVRALARSLPSERLRLGTSVARRDSVSASAGSAVIATSARNAGRVGFSSAGTNPSSGRPATAATGR